MSEIPDDIMQAASKAYFDAFDENDQASIHAVLRNIGSAILSERQRQAEVMEEVRKVADLVVNNPAFFTTTYEERPYATITFDNAEAAHRFNDGLIGLRALLSRLEER